MLKKILLLVLLTGIVVGPAYAVSNIVWEQKTKTDFYRGDLNNVMISGKGEILLANVIKKIELQKDGNFLWALAKNKNNIFVGLGNCSKVYRYDKNTEKVSVIFQSDTDLAVSSLLYYKKSLYIGTLPYGNIYRYKNNNIEKFATVSDSYVWQLVTFDDKLLAGTGSSGKIYEISLNNRTVKEVAALKDKNIITMKSAENYLYAGGSEEGILYRLDKNYNVDIIADFPQNEIRQILVLNDNSLYVAANLTKQGKSNYGRKGKILGSYRVSSPKPKKTETSKSIDGEEPGEKLTETSATEMAADRPKKEEVLMPDKSESVSSGENIEGSPFVESQNGLIYYIKNNYVNNVYEILEQYIFDILVKDNNIYIATGPKGNLYKLDLATNIDYLLNNFKEKNILKLIDDKDGIYIGTANPGSCYKIFYSVADTGTFVSSVNDCIFKGDFGRLYYWGNFDNQDVKVSLRTGNVSKPDKYWSDWYVLNNTGDITKLLRSRFVQYKVDLKKHTNNMPVINKVRLYYSVPNQPPKILSFSIDDQEVNRPFSDIVETKEQENNFDDEINYFVDEKYTAKTTIKNIVWKTKDLDGDKLVYDLFYKPVGNYSWKKLNKKNYLNGNSVKWETKNIPDGFYKMKLVAYDMFNNSMPNIKSASKISDKVVVDNTPPKISGLKYSLKKGNLNFLFQAEDSLSFITRVVLSYDNKHWYLIFPKDKIFDSKTEKFDIELRNMNQKNYNVIIKVYDSEKNEYIKRIFVE